MKIPYFILFPINADCMAAMPIRVEEIVINIRISRAF
jgi:hypothetical protein